MFTVIFLTYQITAPIYGLDRFSWDYIMFWILLDSHMTTQEKINKIYLK